MATLLADADLDAVFVANDLMTVGALECLIQHDVQVPREIGVVGFDEIPWASLAPVSYLKRGYGWDRTRLDGRHGAAIWCGHGVFAHNLIKITALTR
jgi:hypothetical protein